MRPSPCVNRQDIPQAAEALTERRGPEAASLSGRHLEPSPLLMSAEGVAEAATCHPAAALHPVRLEVVERQACHPTYRPAVSRGLEARAYRGPSLAVQMDLLVRQCPAGPWDHPPGATAYPEHGRPWRAPKRSNM